MRKLYTLTVCAWLSLSQNSWANYFPTADIAILHPSQEGPKISLKITNVSLDKLLKEVQQKTGISILYRPEQIDGIDKITVEWKDQNVFRALADLLKEKGLDCNYNDNTFVIASREKQRPTDRNSTSAQEQYPVTGYVIDANGNPISGASVYILNTSIQLSTDVKGFFKVLLPSHNAQLAISYVGFEGKREFVKSGQHVKIQLLPLVAAIDDVVVTGYQDVNRERMTGSVTTVKAADIEGKGFGSIDEILIGRVSGLSGFQSGKPGEDVRIQIRGINSLTGNTDPIWIVDGMPMQGAIPNIRNGVTDLQNAIFTTGIGNLSPDDIESITVLKDAAATAVYGARAANGVIVVKTKSGISGKTRFTASVNYGVKLRPVNNISMMNSLQKIQFEKELYEDLNFREIGRVGDVLQKRDLGLISFENANEQIQSFADVNTDWFKEIFNPAHNQQYNFSISGGTVQTQYYMSANHSNQNGIQPNNNFNRSGMNMKLNHDPRENMRITASLGTTLKNDRSTASIIDPLKYALYANTYEKPFNPDGSLAFDQSYDMEQSKLRPGLSWSTLNALDDMKRNTKSSRYISSDVSLKFEYEVIPGLQFISAGIYNATANNNRMVQGANTYTNFKTNWYNFKEELPLDYVRGSLNEGSNYSDMFSFRNSLSFTKKLKDKHFVNVMAAQEVSQMKHYSSSNYSPVFDEDHRVIGYPELRGVDPLMINLNVLGRTGMGVTKSSSFFTNASYSFLDKYIMSGSIRYDGSDIIGNDNQFTPLWNLSGRWNLHHESFMKTISWLDEASLRASYGFTGSIDNNAFPFIVINFNNSYMYDGQVLPSSFQHANPNVKWQTKRDVNMGLNLALFNRRVEVGMNYYYNNTRDVLDARALPLSSGRPNATQNIADLLNKGWEFDLGLTLVKRKSFTWMVSGNLGVNDNLLTKTYYQSAEDLPVRTFESSKTAIENYPAWSWFGYEFAKVNPANGHIIIHTPEGNGFDMELLHNPMLNLGIPHASYLGKSNPPIYGGFGSNVIWKQFIFGANFEFKAGHLIPSFNTYQPISSANRHENDVNRWRQPGDDTNVAQINSTNSASGRYMYDVRLEKGDFLRASLVTLGYNLDKEILRKIGLYTARISFNARDLFTLTAYKGIDPNLLGQMGYPNTRSYNVSLNLGF